MKPLLFAALMFLAHPAVCFAGEDGNAASPYPREHIYGTAVGSDEALVNLSVTVNRWPDCTTLESAVHDIFRLEGVAAGNDQDKALALWKWFRVLVSPTGGHYAYEGPAGRERLCPDPHRIFAVYGHHQCDGLSWAMVALWRAAGYMALDECTTGHTTAALRYRDADGQMRYHSFDPQRRYYHWDEANQRVGTRSLPVLRGMVYRHLTAPQQLHSLRTSLRIGEQVLRRWDNQGHVVPSGPDKRTAFKQRYYAYQPAATKGVYTVAGEEVQTLEADTQPATFARSMYEGSAHVACSPPQPDKATLHPLERDRAATLIYRLAPPYVVADARCEATLVKNQQDDVCRLLVSWDGLQWTPMYTKESLGTERVALDIGREAWEQGRANVFTAYQFFVKAEMHTAGEPRGVGIQNLRVTAHRMLNKRALPNLRPGENIVRVTADRIDPAFGLELNVDYLVDGQPRRASRFVQSFPDFFPIDVPGVPEEAQESYDQQFNEGRLRMVALSLRLLPAGQRSPSPTSLQASEAEKHFAIASPHPAKFERREPVSRPERDVRETSGFFPQSDEVLTDERAVVALREGMASGTLENRWMAVEDYGAHPENLNVLLAKLPSAEGDMTIYLCKALARLKDPRAVAPLLEKWKRAPLGAPGTRYIPDVLAAIGDRSVVPQLIAPLKRCRYDYRFHIAHALGVLGGPEAVQTLKDLAANDPFPAVRELAAEALRDARP